MLLFDDRGERGTRGIVEVGACESVRRRHTGAASSSPTALALPSTNALQTVVRRL